MLSVVVAGNIIDGKSAFEDMPPNLSLNMWGSVMQGVRVVPRAVAIGRTANYRRRRRLQMRDNIMAILGQSLGVSAKTIQCLKGVRLDADEADGGWYVIAKS